MANVRGDPAASMVRPMWYLDELETLSDPLTLLVRHAEREDVRSANDIFTAPLTDKGRQDARKVGAAFAKRGTITFAHSPVPRCEDTAACMAEGARAAGARAEIVGMRPELGGLYIVDIEQAFRAYVADRQRFVRRWFEGELGEDVLLSRRETAKHQLEVVQELHGNTPLTVLVSHDWNIMSVREEFLGVRHEDTGWLGFMDGVAHTEADDARRLRWSDVSRDYTL